MQGISSSFVHFCISMAIQPDQNLTQPVQQQLVDANFMNGQQSRFLPLKYRDIKVVNTFSVTKDLQDNWDQIMPIMV